ncbi:hypothetical protein MHYP_G00177280 [Metynnis hypsauchen]
MFLRSCWTGRGYNDTLARAEFSIPEPCLFSSFAGVCWVTALCLSLVCVESSIKAPTDSILRESYERTRARGFHKSLSIRSVMNESSPDDSWTEGQGIEGLGAQRIFAAISFLMALSSGVLCLVFAFCWTSRTVRSYSNTRSLLMAGQALYPTTLLLITLAPTGFLFLLSWALFTNQHIAEIQDITRLGSSYWLGVVGWALLLAVLPVVFLVEQCVVPDVLPELMRAAETWWKAPEVAYARSFSESYYNKGPNFNNGFKRHMSVP